MYFTQYPQMFPIFLLPETAEVLFSFELIDLLNSSEACVCLFRLLSRDAVSLVNGAIPQPASEAPRRYRKITDYMRVRPYPAYSFPKEDTRATKEARAVNQLRCHLFKFYVDVCDSR
ncbi:hypothetical protein GEMRC1_010130 [Eukaryota sp. GEM-RC1]